MLTFQVICVGIESGDIAKLKRLRQKMMAEVTIGRIIPLKNGKKAKFLEERALDWMSVLLANDIVPLFFNLFKARASHSVMIVLL